VLTFPFGAKMVSLDSNYVSEQAVYSLTQTDAGENYT
jgi:hypothetical protein